MYPAAFDYLAPTSLDEALGILAERGDEAKVMAGGQSLIPLMKLRLAAPSVVVDLGRLDDLQFRSADGGPRSGRGSATPTSRARRSSPDVPAAPRRGAADRRSAGPQHGTVGGLGSATPTRGRLGLGDARPGGELRAALDRRGAHGRGRRLLHRAVHDGDARRRGDDRDPDPGAAGRGRRAPTSSSSARSATSPPSAWRCRSSLRRGHLPGRHRPDRGRLRPTSGDRRRAGADRPQPTEASIAEAARLAAEAWSPRRPPRQRRLQAGRGPGLRPARASDRAGAGTGGVGMKVSVTVNGAAERSGGEPRTPSGRLHPHAAGADRHPHRL